MIEITEVRMVLEGLVARRGLPSFTTRTITDLDRLRVELARTRDRGVVQSIDHSSTR